MVSDELVITVARAFAKAEGFGTPGAVPTRAHNPGDLTDDGDVGNGLIHTSGEHGAPITVYANDSDGWAALYKKVRRMLDGHSHVYLPTMSIEEVALKYSGDRAWGENVARSLGNVSTSTTLADLAAMDAKIKSDGAENA